MMLGSDKCILSHNVFFGDTTASLYSVRPTLTGFFWDAGYMGGAVAADH
jgi:hypothetical protein